MGQYYPEKKMGTNIFEKTAHSSSCFTMAYAVSSVTVIRPLPVLVFEDPSL